MCVFAKCVDIWTHTRTCKWIANKNSFGKKKANILTLTTWRHCIYFFWTVFESRKVNRLQFIWRVQRKCQDFFRCECIEREKQTQTYARKREENVIAENIKEIFDPSLRLTDVNWVRVDDIPAINVTSRIQTNTHTHMPPLSAAYLGWSERMKRLIEDISDAWCLRLWNNLILILIIIIVINYIHCIRIKLNRYVHTSCIHIIPFEWHIRSFAEREKNDNWSSYRIQIPEIWRE